MTPNEEEAVAKWTRFPLPQGPFEYQNSISRLKDRVAGCLEGWILGRRGSYVQPWHAAAGEVVDLIITEASTDPIFSEIRRQQGRLHAAVETLQEIVNERVHIEGLIAKAIPWTPDKFADRIPIKGSHFVYLLYRSFESSPVYVGETASVFRRVGQHVVDAAKQFDEVAILEYKSKKEALECERRLIAKLKPEYNIKGTGKRYKKVAA